MSLDVSSQRGRCEKKQCDVPRPDAEEGLQIGVGLRLHVREVRIQALQQLWTLRSDSGCAAQNARIFASLKMS